MTMTRDEKIRVIRRHAAQLIEMAARYSLKAGIAHELPDEMIDLLYRIYVDGNKGYEGIAKDYARKEVRP